MTTHLALARLTIAVFGIYVVGCGGQSPTGPTASSPVATPVPSPIAVATPPVPEVAAPRLSADAPVLIAAGDIGDCTTRGDEATAKLLDTIPGTVLTLGDNVQAEGTAEEFRDCYDPTWGRQKYRTRPVPGNHDYNTPGAAAYYSYFGDKAGPPDRGYYSFNFNGWLVLALNSEIDISAASPQVAWLRQTLRQENARCIVAAWHAPFVSSGPSQGTGGLKFVWQVLQDFGADVVLAGHDHFYERFAPVNAAKQVDHVNGIRSFIVGTGGGALMGIVSRHPASVAKVRSWGVLKIFLMADRYEWAFVAVDGTVFDQGHGSCNGPGVA